MAIFLERAVQSVDRKACSLCIMSIGNFIHLPFLGLRTGFGVGLLSCYFCYLYA